MDQPYSLDGIIYKKFKRPISPLTKISKLPKIELLNINSNLIRLKNKRKIYSNFDSNKLIKIN